MSARVGLERVLVLEINLNLANAHLDNDIVTLIDKVGIVPRTTGHPIGTGSTLQYVAAGSAKERVTAALTLQDVVAGKPGYDIVAVIAVDCVVGASYRSR